MYNLTTTCRFGGVETFVWEVSRELARTGEEVHIIGGEGNILKDIPGVKISLFPFWPRERIPNLGTRFRKMGERCSFGRWAYPHLLRERFDVIHIHKPFDLPWSWALKRKTGCKVILGSHGTDFFPGDKFFIQAVDRAVSCSRFNASQIQERYGIIPRVIYNGIDPQIFRPLLPDLNLKRQLQFPDSSPVILFTGRLIGLKGVQVLLRAAGRLPPRDPWRILVIGEGGAKDSLKNLCRDLGIQERVFFTGFIPNHELPKYYSLADLAVFPSLADESFGMAICEAMACARAVLSTRVGGIPELILDGESGVLVEPNNVGELGDQIARLLRDPDKRLELGGSALDRVKKLFTWEKVAERLKEAYNADWI
jgi:glycosyltransferase involved in cell wall biosynthesis